MTRIGVKAVVFILIAGLCGCAATQSENTQKQNWNSTIERVSNGVVSIQFDVPVSFDGNWNTSSYATGFIVDAKRGIILTNRHVVTPGPVTAKAILLNNEEIELTPIYIDPVHDFGFYQYNPEDIQYVTPHEFELAPESAHVGQDIRIVGNDDGQKLSILDGTISRLDRDAPNYGAGRYNDFNTYYIQASTASTGGSSGSPVINVEGQVVAINAGAASRSANAFYLPLNSVTRALHNIQQGKAIARGGLLTTFISTPYAELQRLGLTPELEKTYRATFADLKGLLTINTILPGSPADTALEVGDILLTINNEPVADFVSLEQWFNQHVGESLSIEVLRQGVAQSFDIEVSDLTALMPTTLLKFDASVFHDLSYQQARHMDKPLEGVFVALASSAFKAANIPNHAVITEFNGEPIANLSQFNEILSRTPDRTKAHIRYFAKSAPKTSQYAFVEINRQWFEHSFCHFNAELGYWPCDVIANTLPPAKQTVAEDLTPLPVANHTGLESALVKVTHSSPYSILGRSGNEKTYGTGVIVDAEKGWIVIDRTIVPSVLGEVKITFNNQLEVDGKVEYLHPLHNLALVSYPTELLGQLPVAEAKLATRPLQRDDAILQMGLNYDGEVEYRGTNIDTVQELWLNRANVPQFAENNIKVAHLVNPNGTIDGIILNEQGELAALWATFTQGGDKGEGRQYFSAGITADYIQELIDHATAQQGFYSLNINLTQIAPVNALQRGLPNEWLNKIINGDTVNNKLLMIYEIMQDSPSSAHFERGDILLAINDQPVTSFKTFEALSQAPSLRVTYLREGQVQNTELETSLLAGEDIDRVLFWAGLTLHRPHRAALMQRGIDGDGVYIASYKYGSPANRYNVYAMRRIVAIDGQPTVTLDDFIAQVKDKQHRESVKLKTLDINNVEEVITLKLDTHYWPFFEVRLVDGEWQKVMY